MLKYVIFIMSLAIWLHGHLVSAHPAYLQHGTQKVEHTFEADTSSTVRPRLENPVSTLSMISSVASVIMASFGYTGNEKSFDPLPVVALFGITSLVTGIIGFIVRRRLLRTKYAGDLKAGKLPLGKTRSMIGVFGLPVSFIIILLAFNSCG
ncbi:hypothetical protein [Dyadobacter sp. CY323]|uniref:hypothetical protein n=1 Tax=Dyadobacter sp. CY323 TaxID=2907302 RepID=UPI001F24AC1E|nr:hypothetical protein [Dyadobacter sp. CY323]MCE6989436.1 hypothetical protein [Dyadobacter sp. CY323]